MGLKSQSNVAAPPEGGLRRRRLLKKREQIFARAAKWRAAKSRAPTASGDAERRPKGAARANFWKGFFMVSKRYHEASIGGHALQRAGPTNLDSGISGVSA